MLDLADPETPLMGNETQNPVTPNEMLPKIDVDVNGVG